MVTEKLKKVGCTSMKVFNLYRGEVIYIQDGKYYPTICNGYKTAAKCNTYDEARKVIDLAKEGGE